MSYAQELGRRADPLVGNGRLKDPSELQLYLHTTRIRRGAKVQWKDAGPAGLSKTLSCSMPEPSILLGRARELFALKFMVSKCDDTG